MTKEERNLIADCKVTVIAGSLFQRHIMPELNKLGFCHVDYTENNGDLERVVCKERFILPFDLIDGAGVIVTSDMDNPLYKTRVKAAQYMAGYCAFWNMQECNWTANVMQKITAGESSVSAISTAAIVCARIAANLAVGREVKLYPRFYISSNLE